jgi:hypothetical protein
MTMLDRHPDEAALTRATDDAFTPGDDDAMRAHVASCASCTDDVTAARALGIRVRQAPLPPLARGLVEGAVARRLAGERVLLAADEGDAAAAMMVRDQPRLWRKSALLAASVGLIVVAAWSLWPSRTLDAAPPTFRLRVAEAVRAPGARVTFTYDALPALAERESLVVRAYAFGGDGPVPGRIVAPVAILRPDGPRRYRGTGVWPEGAAVVAAAVELPDGSVTDANDGALVDVLATDPSGKPTFDALVHAVMQGRTDFLAPASRHPALAQRLALADLERRFGDRPETWALLAEEAGPSSFWDAWFGAFGRRTRALQKLDARLKADRDLPIRARRAMWRLAQAQEETQVASEWAAVVGDDSLSRWERREARIAEVVRSRDSAAARAFVRDSLLRPIDLFAGLAIAGWWAVSGPSATPTLMSCAELRDGLTRAMDRMPAPARLPGQTLEHYERRLGGTLASARASIAVCGMSLPGRRAAYYERLRALLPPPPSKPFSERTVLRSLPEP